MVSRVGRWISGRTLQAIGVFALLTTSLYTLGTVAEDLERYDRLHTWLLLLNGVALLVMAGMIVSSAVRLIRDFRSRAVGARLTGKLVLMFVLITFIPVCVVFTFSVKILRSGFNNSFDVEVEQALTNALELGRDSLATRMRTLNHTTQQIAKQLEERSSSDAIAILHNKVSETGATELTLLGSRYDVVASAGGNLGVKLSVKRLEEDILIQARRGETYVGVDPIGDSAELFVQVLTPVPNHDPAKKSRMLHALYPIPERSGRLAESVQSSYQDYRQLTFLREPYQFSYVATLFLVFLLSLLMATWAAFYMARRVTQPIHELAEATKDVAEGNYGIRLANVGNDEMGTLVHSFNEMTERLAQARDQARLNQVLVESQRAYLEAVLARVSTGVITLSPDARLRTANNAASKILDVELEAWLGRSLAEAHETEEPRLQQFFRSLLPHILKGQGEWRAEFEVFDSQGHRVLTCRGAALSYDGRGSGGYVLVFDDISPIMRAQREAAWSEVARRLAHEIKNPLTPIQLSAERIRHKLLNKMDEKDAAMIDRTTHTIVQQVEALKSMVKAFAEYADAPTANFVRLDFNALVREVTEIYRGMGPKLNIMLDLQPNLARVSADTARLRQLLLNLVKNALEAQGECDIASVSISTSAESVDRDDYLKLVVEDDGPGFPPEQLDRLFEPYVTSKPKGTGLGLAIVKKIVEEHGGVIEASNREWGGARISILLPMMHRELFEEL